MIYSLRKLQEAAAKRNDQEWGSLTWLASQAIGNAQGVTLGRVTIKKGCSNPRHIHYNCEEVLYVLRGKVEHTMGDERAILEPGDTLVVAAGVPHGATNIGDDDVDAIIAYSSGIRDMVLES